MQYSKSTIITVSAGKLFRRFCKMFSESSIGRLAIMQLPYCPSKRAIVSVWNSKRKCYKTFRTSCACLVFSSGQELRVLDQIKVEQSLEVSFFFPLSPSPRTYMSSYHRRNAACYSWLKGTKRSLGIATTAAAAGHDREAVDHGLVGLSHGTLLARFVSHCRGLDRLQQARAQQASSALRFFQSSSSSTHSLLKTWYFSNSYRAVRGRHNQNWKYKLISLWYGNCEKILHVLDKV